MSSHGMDVHADITVSSENYLEVIYDLSAGGRPVRSVEVAKEMNVSKASVNKAVGILRDAGFVEQELYGSIELTPLGLARAKAVMLRHQVIKRFLIQILGIDPITADEDACRMEHVISEQTMERWRDFMEREGDLSDLTELLTV